MYNGKKFFWSERVQWALPRTHRQRHAARI